MTQDGHHIIFSYAFDGKGGGKPVPAKNTSREIKSDNKLAWVHMDANDPDTKTWLEHEISYLDPFIVQALLAEETRPRITEIGDGALIILRGVNLNKNAAPEDMISVRLWVDPYRIISVQKRQLKAVMDIEESINAGKGPRNSGDFIATLMSRLFEHMEPVFLGIHEQIDDIEEEIMEETDHEMREDVVSIRKKAIIFRRYIAPQRDIVGHLRTTTLALMSLAHKRQMLETHDRATRYIEDLDAARERSQIVKDELSNAMAIRLNRNMYVLSVIAAIFLPITFVTGLFGINVTGIPLAGDAVAFWKISGILIGVVLFQVLLFKRFKWF